MRTLTALAAAVAVLAVAAALAAPAHAASLSLRPAIAVPGATVAAEGAGWRPGATVTIRRRGGARLARARAGPDGRFAASLRLPRNLGLRAQPLVAESRPDTVASELRVVATPREWAPKSVAFSWTPVRIVISRTVAFPTAPVRVDFLRLRPGYVAAASIADAPAVRTRADRHGRAAVRLTVPGTRLESTTLSLRGGHVVRVEPFYVVPPQTVVPPIPPPLRPVPLLAAAGDVACRPGQERTVEECHQDATAALVAQAQPDAVAMLGDGQYDVGAPDEWSAYDTTWGRTHDRTRPAIGNHEYRTPGAAGYFPYFGALAGAPDRAYYSYNLGAWHVVVLNSNCWIVSCVPNSSQERWLRADLAAHPNRCTLAYWHHPRHSSAQQSRENMTVDPLWRALAEGGADLVLTAHVHNYERIAPLDADGAVSHARGMRSFVVGTGGRSSQRFAAIKHYSEKSSADTFGILLLSLRPEGYDWNFTPEAGRDFTDTGSASCH
jgi:hypothetical protein